MSLPIAAAQARRLVLALQGLADPPRRPLTGDGVVDLIERLGFLQVDSISTVARAHHMILFTRSASYRPELLKRALEDEVRLFEHWTYDVAAILPMSFYPYWKLRFAREREALERRFRRWHGAAHQDELERVLSLIREHGPILARDLAEQRARPAGGWWDWHLGKTALEYLWRTGRLAIARRQGFQKVYDLAERVIPAAVRESEPGHALLVDWACRGALERLGVASAGEIARFFGLVTIAEAKTWGAENLGGEALPVMVEAANGAAPRALLARPDIAELLPRLPERAAPAARAQPVRSAAARPQPAQPAVRVRLSDRGLRAGAAAPRTATTSSRCSRASVWSAAST